MRVSISQNSIRRLRAFIEEVNPRLGLAEAMHKFKVGVKVTRLVIQRNNLEKMLKLGAVGKEILNRARGNICANKNLGLGSKALKKECNRLLRFRITKKNKEVKEMQRKWYNLQEQAERKIPVNGRPRYKKIRQDEVSRVWSIEKDKAREKLERLARTNQLPPTLSGIILGDHELLQRYGELRVALWYLGAFTCPKI